LGKVIILGMRKISESERISCIEEKWSGKLPELFCAWHWKENLKHSEIGERIGVPRPTITRWFRQFGVPTQPCTRFTNLNLLNTGPRKTPSAKPKIKKKFPWKFNAAFFNTWTSEMAYVLGFLIADGYVFKNPRGSHYIGFTSTDKEIIEKIREVLESNHKIGVRKHPKHPKWKDSYVLQIGSKETVSRLEEFGIVQNKSLVIKYPQNIPEEFFGHFVRGYFDGDGCVYFRQHYRKDRGTMKWVFSTCFTSGSKAFLMGLQNKLTSHMKGGAIRKKVGGYELVFSHHDSLALFRFMYNNTSNKLFLERKHKIFSNAIETLCERP